MEEMDYKETNRNIEEFSRVQTWLEMTDKDSEIFKSLYIRYNELKAILMVAGVNLVDIDRFKNQ